MISLLIESADLLIFSSLVVLIVRDRVPKMAILDFPTSAWEFANPPTNYLGTFLFLAYLLLAISLTISTSLSLYRTYRTLISPDENAEPHDKNAEASRAEVRKARARHIKIYAVFASISFAMLSQHLLGFLVTSYLDWSGSGSASLWSIDISVERLRQWMLESQFFEDFARELVGDGPSVVWTQVALVGTWFWNVWMAEKANEHAIPWTTMLPYILLGQSLPTSFAVTLFLIHLHLSSPDLAPMPPPDSNEQQVKLSTSEAHPSSPTSLQPQLIHKSKTSLTLPTVLLNATLLSLPALRHHRTFIPLVLFTRLLLLLPHSGRIDTRNSEMMRVFMLSGGFIVANLAMLKKGYGVGDIMRGFWGGDGNGNGVYGGEAVRALAWDAVLGALVSRVMWWGGGV